MQTLTENILNVTLLEPRLKHPTIFRYFDELTEGESLTIHNDHDPKPLYYQLLSERGNIFTWEYLEEGPIWWKVRITRRKSGEAEETLGECRVVERGGGDKEEAERDVKQEADLPAEQQQHVRYLRFTEPVPTRRVVLAWRKSFPRYEAIAALRNAIYACPLPGVTRLTG